jgi:hypothetical protein
MKIPFSVFSKKMVAQTLYSDSRKLLLIQKNLYVGEGASTPYPLPKKYLNKKKLLRTAIARASII